MKNFRISFGSASCSQYRGTNPFFKETCALVLEKISELKKLKYEQLQKWNELDISKVNINGSEVVISVFQDYVKEDSKLVVVQAFCHTLKSPNYFSFSGIGRIFSEGFLINKYDEIKNATDKELWGYR